jgi:peptidoglycan/LPS O-acetylase OafA/YrhL
LLHLDALRGIAAIGVVSCHCMVWLKIDRGWLHDISHFGQHGVQLFYIISAFTLCYSANVRTKGERYPLSNYFIRRFFRIAPLFYVAVAANLAYYGLGPREGAPDGLSIWQVVLGIFFLNGFDPVAINSVAIGGWSIAVETTFYLLLPGLLCWVKNLTRSILLLAITSLSMPALSYAGDHMTHEKHTEFFHFLWFPCEFPVFCLGIFLYFLWDQCLAGRKVPYRRCLSLLLLVFSLLTIWLGHKLPLIFRLYGMSTGLGMLTLSLCLHNWKFLVNAVTVYLGKISYSIYLGHFYALLLVVYFLGKSKLQAEPNVTCLTLLFSAVLFVAIPLATVTFNLIEKPGILQGRNWIRYREGHDVKARL